MNLNATMIGQAIAFFILIWFSVKFIWPELTNAIEERQKKIAEGLSAADKSQKDLVEAKEQANVIVREAREKAAKIVEQANRRGNEMVDEAKGTAQAEGQRLLAEARSEVALEKGKVRDQLRAEVATLAIAGASKVLGREIDARAHADLIEQLATQIERA